MILFNFREKIKTSPAKRDKAILVCFLVALMLNIVLWGLLLFNFEQSSEYIVLRYTVYFGISSLGPWQYILLLPLIGLLVLLINTLIAFSFYLKYRVLSYFFTSAAIFINAMILIAGSLLVYFNI